MADRAVEGSNDPADLPGSDDQERGSAGGFHQRRPDRALGELQARVRRTGGLSLEQFGDAPVLMQRPLARRRRLASWTGAPPGKVADVGDADVDRTKLRAGTVSSFDRPGEGDAGMV